jgi:hypothetical protein
MGTHATAFGAGSFGASAGGMSGDGGDVWPSSCAPSSSRVQQRGTNARMLDTVFNHFLAVAREENLLEQQAPADASTDATGAGSVTRKDLRLPLCLLVPALRASGLRLQAEDVHDIESVASSFAPLSRAHFVHFAEQALGRHTYDDELCAAFDAVAAGQTLPVAAVGVSPPRPPRPSAPGLGACSMDQEQLRNLVCGGQGDALSEEEWADFLATLDFNELKATSSKDGRIHLRANDVL